MSIGYAVAEDISAGTLAEVGEDGMLYRARTLEHKLIAALAKDLEQTTLDNARLRGWCAADTLFCRSLENAKKYLADRS